MEVVCGINPYKSYVPRVTFINFDNIIDLIDIIRDVHVKMLIGHCFKSVENHYENDLTIMFIRKCLNKKVKERPIYKELSEMLKEPTYLIDEDELKRDAQKLLKVRKVIKNKIYDFFTKRVDPRFSKERVIKIY